MEVPSGDCLACQLVQSYSQAGNNDTTPIDFELAMQKAAKAT